MSILTRFAIFFCLFGSTYAQSITYGGSDTLPGKFLILLNVNNFFLGTALMFLLTQNSRTCMVIVSVISEIVLGAECAPLRS